MSKEKWCRECRSLQPSEGFVSRDPHKCENCRRVWIPTLITDVDAEELTDIVRTRPMNVMDIPLEPPLSDCVYVVHTQQLGGFGYDTIGVARSLRGARSFLPRNARYCWYRYIVNSIAYHWQATYDGQTVWIEHWEVVE